MTPKVPRSPKGPLQTTATDIIDFNGELVRIHRTDGPNAYPWNSMRPVGPLEGMRWDQHPLPGTGVAHPCSILYTATLLSTALAEVYQQERKILLVAGRPHLTMWTPTRPLQLLDLSGDWPIRNGASHALNAAPRPTCRSWARIIHTEHPALDGLYVTSTMTGRPCVVLWEHAADSLPEHPTFSRSLEDISLDVENAAATLGYRLIL